MVFIDSSGTKKIMCLSQISCMAARSLGIPEISVTDHDLEQLVVETWYSMWSSFAIISGWY